MLLPSPIIPSKDLSALIIFFLILLDLTEMSQTPRILPRLLLKQG